MLFTHLDRSVIAGYLAITLIISGWAALETKEG